MPLNVTAMKIRAKAEQTDRAGPDWGATIGVPCPASPPGEAPPNDGKFRRALLLAGSASPSDAIHTSAQRAWLVGTVRMAHICAAAGREPAKVGEDCEFETLDHRAKTAHPARDPPDMRRVSI
jgi:hypothetical protein